MFAICCVRFSARSFRARCLRISSCSSCSFFSRSRSSSSRFLLASSRFRSFSLRSRSISCSYLGDLYTKSWQTLQGSFSAVSKPKFASKYAFESSRRDLHNALLCTALRSHGAAIVSTLVYDKLDTRSRLCRNRFSQPTTRWRLTESSRLTFFWTFAHLDTH